MRTVRAMTGLLLTGGTLLGLAAPAHAATTPPAASSPPSPSSPSSGSSDTSTPDSSTSADSSGSPTEAGTSFRTATPVKLGQKATADASTGDYLYWSIPLDAGQQATVKTKVTLPVSARHGTATWQLDVYDGLRRRQPCVYGAQTGSAPKDATTLGLSCTLRPVRSWADPWSNTPLPGTYYARLTTTALPQDDLGQPAHAELEATAIDAGGAQAGDGSLAAPLLATGAKPDGTPPAAAPEGGWASGNWSDRWLWTAIGAAVAALTGIAGYTLTRGRGRPHHLYPHHVPPHHNPPHHP